MIKRLLLTVFMVPSVSFGTMLELCNIQDPIDPATLVVGVAYRSYGENIPCNIDVTVRSIMNGDPNAVDVFQNLKNQLCFEACEILSNMSYLRSNCCDDTTENEANLQRLFWNRIHLLQVWYVKYLDLFSTLSAMYPERAEAAEAAVKRVNLFLNKFNTFCERFNQHDIAPFKLTGSGWTKNYSYEPQDIHWHHSNVKQLQMLQALYSLSDGAEDIVLLPDDVPLATIEVPAERPYIRPDVSGLAFDPFIQYSPRVDPEIEGGILQPVDSNNVQKLEQEALTYIDNDSAEPLPGKLWFIQKMINYCFAILDELVPIKHPKDVAPTLHQLFWDNFHCVHKLMAITLTHAKLQESSRVELHRLYSRLVCFQQSVDEHNVEYFQRPDTDVPHRVLDSNVEGRADLYPSERFIFLFRSIFN